MTLRPLDLGNRRICAAVSSFPSIAHLREATITSKPVAMGFFCKHVSFWVLASRAGYCAADAGWT